MSTFDANHKAIISAFMSLKSKATLLEKDLLIDSYHINRNNLPFIEVQNYFSLLRSVCDLPLFMMINEEVSSVGARHLIPKLVDEMRADKCIATHVTVGGELAEISQGDFHASLSDIRELFVGRVNHMVSSMMLDFTVSAFSCFEYWITKLYDGYPELDTAYSESRTSKASKLIELAGAASSPECQRKLVNQALNIRGSFVHFPTNSTLFTRWSTRRRTHETSIRTRNLSPFSVPDVTPSTTQGFIGTRTATSRIMVPPICLNRASRSIATAIRSRLR